jgi:hypothetical protein
MSLKCCLSKFLSLLPPLRKEHLIDLALDHIAEVSYFRLAQNGFHPTGVIDIGPSRPLKLMAFNPDSDATG